MPLFILLPPPSYLLESFKAQYERRSQEAFLIVTLLHTCVFKLWYFDYFALLSGI